MEQLEKIIHSKIVYINRNRQLENQKIKDVKKEAITKPFLYVNFSKNDYIFGGTNTKEYVETSVKNYVGLKRQTTQSILPDPESAKQHMQNRNLQCYQYWHCTDHWLMQIDPCTSWWTMHMDGELSPLQVNGQQFRDELMKPAK